MLSDQLRKSEHLHELSEEGLHSRVVRPLLTALKYSIEDAPALPRNSYLYSTTNAFGEDELIAVCPRVTPITNAPRSQGRASEVLDDVRQLLDLRLQGTPLSGKAVLRVIIATTSSISQRVQETLKSTFGSARLAFWDPSQLIPLIDRYVPEFWLAERANAHIYLRTLAAQLSEDSFHPKSMELGHNEAFLNGATDERYVDVSAYINAPRVRQRQGQAYVESEMKRVRVLQLPEEPHRLISLIGDAGTGKSTGIRRLAYTMAERALKRTTHSTVPVIVRALDIDEKRCPTLEDCAKGIIAGDAEALPFSTQDLTDGQVSFFVDALDEVPDNAHRIGILRMILAFNQQFPKCQVIVTTRNYSSIRELPEFNRFTAYTISAMGIDQAERLVGKLLKTTDAEKRSILVKDVFARLVDVHGVELSPLLVSVFVATAEDQLQDVPANITEMFSKWTELMLGRWDRPKGFSKQYQAPLKGYIASHIAFQLHSLNVTHMTVGEFEDTVTNYLRERGLSADINQLLDELLNRSGLFRRYSGRIEFRHQILQEFFAGRAIPNDAFAAEVIGDERWRMAIVFYFGSTPGNASGLKSLASRIAVMEDHDAFNAAITIGLALQASYLTKLDDKGVIFGQTLSTLATSDAQFLDEASAHGTYPQVATAILYLVGKDAVALKDSAELVAGVLADVRASGLSDVEKERATFWAIIGLLESYNLKEAEVIIRQFRPRNVGLLLAIDMCCSLLLELRLKGTRDKRIVKEIRASLDGRLSTARKELLKEIRAGFAEEREKRHKEALQTHARALVDETSAEALATDSQTELSAPEL